MHTVAVVSAPAFGKNVCPIEEQECAMRKIRRGSRVVRSMACTANSWVSGIVDEIHDGTFSFQHALLHLSWGPSGQLPLPYSLHSTKSWGKGSSSTTVLSHSVKSPVAGVDAAAPALPCTRKKNTLATSSTCTACVASIRHHHACACHTCACTAEPVESRSIGPCWCQSFVTYREESTISRHRREGSVSLDSSPVQSGIFPNV